MSSKISVITLAFVACTRASPWVGFDAKNTAVQHVCTQVVIASPTRRSRTRRHALRAYSPALSCTAGCIWFPPATRQQQQHATDFRRGEHARIPARTLSPRLHHPFAGPRPPKPIALQRLRGRQHAVASGGGSETSPPSCRPCFHR